MVVLFLVGYLYTLQCFKFLILWYNGWHIYQKFADSYLSGSKTLIFIILTLIFIILTAFLPSNYLSGICVLTSLDSDFFFSRYTSFKLDWVLETLNLVRKIRKTLNNFLIS